MNLLPQKELENKKRSEETLRISRIKDLREAEGQLRLSLAKAELDFQNTLAKNRKQFAEEEDEFLKRRAQMKKEAERLTAEQMSIAVPFEILKEGAEGKLKFAQELLDKTKKQESENEDLKERLEEKLSEVEEKESDLGAKEDALRVREDYIREKNAEMIETQTRLALAVNQFNDSSIAKSKEFKEKDVALKLKETALDSREQGLLGREKDLSDRETRLKDEREVLSKAWNELKGK